MSTPTARLPLRVHCDDMIMHARTQSTRSVLGTSDTHWQRRQKRTRAVPRGFVCELAKEIHGIPLLELENRRSYTWYEIEKQETTLHKHTNTTAAAKLAREWYTDGSFPLSLSKTLHAWITTVWNRDLLADRLDAYLIEDFEMLYGSRPPNEYLYPDLEWVDQAVIDWWSHFATSEYFQAQASCTCRSRLVCLRVTQEELERKPRWMSHVSDCSHTAHSLMAPCSF